MINFFEKKENKEFLSKEKIVLVCCLLIHAAKMDNNYTETEKAMIIQALNKLYNKNEDELKIIIKEAEKKEEESNQILDTKIIATIVNGKIIYNTL